MVKDKKIKLNDICNVTLNKRNLQISLQLRKKKMKLMGIKTNEVLNFFLLKKQKTNN